MRSPGTDATVAALATAVAPAATLVRPAARLRGTVALPGDKSISHRALMLAMLGTGESRISGASDGADVRSTAGIVEALGADVERLVGGGLGGRVEYRVVSPGPGGLRSPSDILDCGNSGTTLRLFAGILAGLPLRAVLDGDGSLRRRPMARLIEPLRAMGADVDGSHEHSVPPVAVIGRTTLRAIDWSPPVPSAQVKSAILLAGLRAEGATRVRESVATRDHTERMLRSRGVPVRSEADGRGGAVIEIEGGGTVQTIDQGVPADPSAAAFWLVAGAIHPAAELRLEGVGVNPTRRRGIDLLRAMGADIEERGADVAEGRADIGEPVADLVVRTSSLRGIDVAPADTAAAIDEIPVLCLAATQASGTTTIRGAGELRAKESDRIAGVTAGLRALGARITVDGDDIRIEGPTPLRGAAVDALGDHRLAMTFAVAALCADGETAIQDAASAAISDPGFFAQLDGVRA